MLKKQQKKAARDKVSDKTSGRKKTTAAASQKLARERLQVIIRSKYQNPVSSAKPTDLESQICQYLVDLEASDKDLKMSLRDLGIVACREQEIAPTKKAIIIFVPYRQLSRWQKIQSRVAVELEKKFSGQDVLFLAQRKVMKLREIKNNYPRPRNQTITSVHERILDDLVYPTKIVGKRLRFRVGGKRILKVYLDPKNSKELEPKLQTYEVVYKKLTKKPVTFLFPRYVI